MKTKIFLIASLLILSPVLILSQNCEVTVKLPTSNTSGNCGFTIKDSVNNVILRENAIGSLYLNMPPTVGGIIHQGDILSINRGAFKLFSAGYYQPENLYYIDIPSPVKMTATWFAAREIHSWPGDTLFFDPNAVTRVKSSFIIDGNTRINNSGCYTGTWTQCSDIRLKNNIRKIDNALNKILNLRGVNYEWRKEEFPSFNFEGGSKIGFIAQEVEKVLPELVNTENDGIKSVNYSNMTAVIIEAMKEQQNIIEEQKRTIQLLEYKLNIIESRINNIEKSDDERAKK